MTDPPRVGFAADGARSGPWAPAVPTSTALGDDDGRARAPRPDGDVACLLDVGSLERPPRASPIRQLLIGTLPECDAIERARNRATERARLRITPTCVIRLDELEWRTTGSGGPGGQHANTSDTRVEVRFPIATSTSLGPRQRARLLEQLGPVARATASDRRSQARNRELALERLRSRLAAALRVDPPRRATAADAGRPRRRGSTPSAASRTRKQDRRRPDDDDHE